MDDKWNSQINQHKIYLYKKMVQASARNHIVYDALKTNCIHIKISCDIREENKLHYNKTLVIMFHTPV